MTSAALGTMRPREIEGLRWAVYARALEPVVTADLDGALTQLMDADHPPTKGTLQRRRGEAREQLAQAKIAQAAVREVLLLDREDLD